MRYTTKLLPSRSGNLGIIQLNNPKALNALTLDMCYSLLDIYNEWHKEESENDKGIKAILVKSSSDDDDNNNNNDDDEKKKRSRRPIFCAGGDVKSIYESVMNPTTSSDDKNNNNNYHGYGYNNLLSSDFFKYEYQVNYKIATNAINGGIPQISLWDGIVMGGGVGLSIHGKYRIVTENTIWSMPETKIGLFPDVGSTYWMTRLLKSKGLGLASYLAITGKHLDASDLLYTGIATHYVPSKNLNELQDALIHATLNKKNDDNNGDIIITNSPNQNSELNHNNSKKSNDVVAPILMSFHEQPPTIPSNSFIANHNEYINKIFSNGGNGNSGDMINNIDEIISNIKKAGDDNVDFGKHILNIINQMSPTSIKITLEALKRGYYNCNNIGECLQMEYRIMQHCIRNINRDTGLDIRGDFYEGIRSVLVDKDNEPKWNPLTLNDVTNDIVNSYFEKLDDKYEWIIPDTSSSSSSKL